MRTKPTPQNESLLTRSSWSRVLLLSLTIAAATLGWFVFRLRSGVDFAQVQSETFTLLAVSAWFNVMNCRSERNSAIPMAMTKNGWLLAGLIVSNMLQAAVIFFEPLNRIFHTVPFSVKEVFAIGALASSVLWIEEFRKFLVRRSSSADTP